MDLSPQRQRHHKSRGPVAFSGRLYKLRQDHAQTRTDCFEAPLQYPRRFNCSAQKLDAVWDLISMRQTKFVYQGGCSIPLRSVLFCSVPFRSPSFHDSGGEPTLRDNLRHEWQAQSHEWKALITPAGPRPTQRGRTSQRSGAQPGTEAATLGFSKEGGS